MSNKPLTGMDRQRADFVESLHNSLRKQASKTIAEHKKLSVLASTYIEDGLEEAECVELLMIDGLSREAAESYTAMAMSKKSEEETQEEYAFQFEDDRGMILSSYDIGKKIYASSEDEAWSKAEEILDSDSIEAQKILSVHRVE